MASNLPRFIRLMVEGETYYATFAMYKGEADGIVSCIRDDVLSPYAKIEVEPALVDEKYVHLRYTRTNKYWSRNNDGLLVAENTMPEEDTTRSSCTLFEPTTPDQDGVFELIHVPTQYIVRADGDQPRFSIRDPPSSSTRFRYVDWETLLKLPTECAVAFKGDNGKYLQLHSKDDVQYLQFSSDDPNNVAAAHWFDQVPLGDVYISPGMQFNSPTLWASSPNWICIGKDSNYITFKPVKVGDNSIALFNTGVQRFCGRTTAEGLTDCLNANLSTFPNIAKFVVQELVLERKIYNVKYDMGISSISDEQPYIAGQSVVVNDSSEEAVMAVEITYQDEKSYTFSQSLAVTAGVSATIEAGIPFIESGSITVSLEITGAFEWDTTTTTTTSVTASASVNVPPKSALVVKYVGTKGTCTVPFSYTQQDKSSLDGSITRIRKDDGSYTGVSCYNFNFQVEKAQSLTLPN
ncbi:uncharacterized protein LOC125206941 [Salvia hispanica]|uniref:uncharacterized protein LOC125206941 n=1 Tax=Salvia hispanica TaxID=49212 RepID=UPI0020092101|nr:uncharacterized protein LOC125206941 [Salvia hispanica]